MSGLLKLLQLLSQLAPFIEVITKLAGNWDITRILEILKKLADAFGGQPKPAAAEALTLSLEKEDLKRRIAEVVAIAKVMATWTTSDVDDKIIAVLEQALTTEWLLDLVVGIANRSFLMTEDLLAAVSA